MVDYFVGIADLLGLPKSVAVVYGVIFASPRPLSFGELNARLDLSAGSISQGLRFLRETGAIRTAEPRSGTGRAEAGRTRRAGEGGPPREYYTPEVEMRKLVLHLIREKYEAHLAGGAGGLKTLAEQIPFEDKDEHQAIRNRLLYLQTWHRKLGALLPVLKTMLALGIG
ncbi:MAG TPA: hypothetical protein VHD32_05455 [Candidatus Didemnitutus sp.]|nr:hypothetical protein [Candidatus Didemnitutus sp.]